MNTWYSKENEFQEMVIDEKTGRTVAVTYEVGQDAEEIATLHNMVEDLIFTMKYLIVVTEENSKDDELGKAHVYMARRFVDNLTEIMEKNK